MDDGNGTLFVYGTLMRGERGHHHLDGCGFISEEQTVRGFGLVHVSWFPGLVRCPGGIVRGELYAVPENRWPALDDYEDCPAVYTRIVVELASGRRAQAYLFRHPGDLPAIPNGDWRARHA